MGGMCEGSPPAPTRAEPRQSRAGLGYVPALDGLRAFAVGGVLLYHGGVSWARGGFMGVDAFFVLSGFLITTLLVGEFAAAGTISLGAFWSRRARRLLPALFVVIAAVSVYAAVLADRVELGRLRGDAFAALTYVANWRSIFSGASYFDQFSAPSPLRHVWSLAIEEQFYLAWPLVVVAVLRWRRSPRALLAVTTVGAAASAVWMAALYRPGQDPSRVYYGTDTRAQSLLIGAALAIVLARRGPVRSTLARGALGAAGWLGAGYTLWLWHATSDRSDSLYRGGYAVAAIAVAAVIASVVQPGRSRLAAALSARPLRRLGQISYGVYLWHWPVYVVLTGERTGLDPTPLLALRLAVTLALSAVSFSVIEAPVRRGAVSGWPMRVLAPATAVALAGAVVLATAGAEPPVAAATRAPSSPAAPETGAGPPPAAASGPDAPTRVLVVGDSVSLTLGMGLTDAQNAGAPVVVDNIGQLGCGISRGGQTYSRGALQPVTHSCDDWPQRWAAEVDRFRPDVAVVLLGVWDLEDREINGRWYRIGTSQHDEYFLHELGTAVDVLGSTGASVVFLTTPYFAYPEEATQTGTDFLENQPWRIDRLNSLYRQIALGRPGAATVLDLNHLVNPSGRYEDSVDGVRTRRDGVHFSVAGRDLVADWLVPRLVEIDRRGIRTLASANASVGG